MCTANVPRHSGQALRSTRYNTLQMCKCPRIWEALAPKKEHAHWVNVWCVLALLRTCCLAEAAVERAISLCGRFSSGMQDIVETRVLSMCTALQSSLSPLEQWAKGHGVAVAHHLVARARFDLRPRRRVRRR